MQIHNSNLHNNQNDSPSGRFVAPVVTGLLAQLLPVGRKSPQENHFWLSSHLVLRRSHALSNLLRRSRFMRSAAILSLFLLILATSAILVPVYNNISVTEAATGTAQNSTLTLNITKASASVDLSVHDSNGTFASSSSDDSVSFNIITNNYTGYELSLGNYNTTTNLVSGSNYLTTIADTISSSTFSATNGTDYNGKWGYLPSKYNSTSNTTNYYPAPAINSTTTLDKTSTSNSTANEYTIGVGARATYSQATGTYSNTFTLTAIANKINYTIQYNGSLSGDHGLGSGSDIVTNMPYSDNDYTQSGDTSSTSITIASNTPLRTGYTFKGWCTAATSDESCSGTTYQPSDTYYIDQTTINAVTFYAMWEEDFTGPDMQNLASSACVTGQSTKVKDTRDGTIYEVQRLADGKCWLLDNLALDLVANKDVLSEANTNATNTQLAYLKGTSTGTTSDQYATGSVINWPDGTSNNWSYSVPYQKTGYETTTGSGGYTAGAYGTYYNYCAASAGTYCYGNGYNDYGSPSGNASADICPKSWRMPTGGNSGEYKILYDKYGNYSTFVAALHTPLSGLYHNESAGGQGSSGSFWSSTYYDASNMYLLFLDTSTVYQPSGSTRAYGRPVRCVLDERIYMQDLNSSNISSLLPNSGDILSVYDNRDETNYVIGKLADGNYWLLDNLALDLVANKNTLSATNTNATNEQLAYLKGTSTGSASDQYATSGVINWPSGTSNNYSYSVPYQNTNSKTKTGSGGYVAGKYGAYYNYCAASAGTYCYGNGTSAGSSASGNATADICPKGWRVPTSGNSGEYKTLYDKYGNYNTFVAALRTPLSGTYSNGSINNQGYLGYLWSSTYYNADYMYALGLNASNSYVNPANFNTRDRGHSIRCILDTRIYMQDLTDSSISTLLPNNGSIATVYDNRDNTAYTVGKLADGNYWLLDNLALDLVANKDKLNSSNTNATNEQLSYLVNGGGTTSDQYATSGASTWTSSGSYSEPLYQMSGTCYNAATWCANTNGKWTYDETLKTTINSNTSFYQGKIGAYYNYCAATAGTYCYGNGSSDYGTPPADVDADADICPKGWRMPTGGFGSEYQNLYDTTYGGDTATFQKALHAPFSGTSQYGTARNQGYSGLFWSSTYNSAYYMYILFADSSSARATGGYNRDFGSSVRCIFGD